MRGLTGAFRQETGVAIDAVRHGLDVARGGSGADRISLKGGRDVVTGTDVAVEDVMRGILNDATGLAVVGEESGGEAPADGSPYWLIDPICGTRNFASGIPLYSVNLGLVEHGRLSIAVVGEPSGEIEVAERGGGAWAVTAGPGRPLVPSGASLVLAVEVGRAERARRLRAAEFTEAAIGTDRWDLCSFNSTISLAYLAAGRIAAYVLFWGTALHTGAGTLLATEAGATVTDLDGRPWTLDSDSIVAAATPELHRDLLDLVGRTDPGQG
jgi:myo-inositol-1(or 4)-monophosphatase